MPLWRFWPTLRPGISISNGGVVCPMRWSCGDGDRQAPQGVGCVDVAYCCGRHFVRGLGSTWYRSKVSRTTFHVQ